MIPASIFETARDTVERGTSQRAGRHMPVACALVTDLELTLAAALVALEQSNGARGLLDVAVQNLRTYREEVRGALGSGERTEAIAECIERVRAVRLHALDTLPPELSPAASADGSREVGGGVSSPTCPTCTRCGGAHGVMSSGLCLRCHAHASFGMRTPQMRGGAP